LHGILVKCLMDKTLLARAYHEGLREGLEMYAHWRDGVQYVGTCGKTLKQALEEINKQEQDALDQLQDRKDIKSELGYSRIGLRNV
jgi:hypothetical protein